MVEASGRQERDHALGMIQHVSMSQDTLAAHHPPDLETLSPHFLSVRDLMVVSGIRNALQLYNAQTPRRFPCVLHDGNLFCSTVYR